MYTYDAGEGPKTKLVNDNNGGAKETNAVKKQNTYPRSRNEAKGYGRPRRSHGRRREAAGGHERPRKATGCFSDVRGKISIWGGVDVF